MSGIRTIGVCIAIFPHEICLACQMQQGSTTSMLEWRHRNEMRSPLVGAVDECTRRCMMYGKLLCMTAILLTGLLYMFGFIGQESSNDKAEPPG